MICNVEIIGDPLFDYNECSFVCQRTDTRAEVCRYTDNSVRSTGVTTDMTMEVAQNFCCEFGNERGDPDL